MILISWMIFKVLSVGSGCQKNFVKAIKEEGKKGEGKDFGIYLQKRSKSRKTKRRTMRCLTPLRRELTLLKEIVLPRAI